MNATIINNSNTNIQIYGSCSDTKDPVNIQDIQTRGITFIGKSSNSDVRILGDCTAKKYIIIDIWSETRSAGGANSTLIYDMSKGKIDTIHNGSFTISFKKINDNDYMLIVTTGASSVWIYLVIIIILTLLVLSLVFGIMWFSKNPGPSQGIGQRYISGSDIPIISD